ncbi:hypothetical protein ACFYP4_23550 [Streptomyces sp. NPDC005551]|uniref:hypothetical protein n=1 Tax=Streptomyces sp. NPDC005551 TaxID=3364725 RepID=UPI00367DFC53
MTGSNRRYAHSESTRLLCAGAHLDTGFRARVIDELIGHEERPAAPSLGVDVVSVLAHAVRARRQEVSTALALGGIWVVLTSARSASPGPPAWEHDDDVQDGPLQVIDHRFEAADGTAYAIRSIGTEGTDVRTPFRVALNSFCPTGADCATA